MQHNQVGVVDAGQHEDTGNSHSTTSAHLNDASGRQNMAQAQVFSEVRAD
jgi:hypothetical protein